MLQNRPVAPSLRKTAWAKVDCPQCNARAGNTCFFVKGETGYFAHYRRVVRASMNEAIDNSSKL